MSKEKKSVKEEIKKALEDIPQRGGPHYFPEVGVRSDFNGNRYIHVDEPEKKKKKKSSWLDKMMKRHE